LTEQMTIPARNGVAQRVAKGQIVQVVNTYGSQVIDTWAFNADDLNEFMSMEHSRPSMGKIIPEVGDSLVTNCRRPILTITEDSTPGVHDTLVAACDRYRYEMLGAEGYHDNCTDNLSEALKELGLEPPEVPSPLNLFMNVPVSNGKSISFEAPVSRAGDHVSLRAEMDLVLVFSSCPQDMVPVNGEFMTVTDAHYTVA